MSLSLFEDSNEFKELLMMATPLKEHFPCAILEKDTARNKDVMSNGQFLGIFHELFVTIELKLIKQAIASLGFTISFKEDYEYFNVYRNLRSSISRNLRKSIYFWKVKSVFFFFFVFFCKLILLNFNKSSCLCLSWFESLLSIA